MKDKIKGKAEEVKGKVTGDKGEELKGKARQGVGNVKGTAKEASYDAEHRGTRKV
ncbi:MAG: CsbD family protein [Candidatus Dormibacteraeota bacterium]|uniref:CsbD family protein n=1 Tax=Candidatus Dormiibacter inghamiae TaxID=3127013 RepID=A0A934NCV2_9BACT|nr:CsbD family protein [Candidatus Dormibacteraeota bacterium]MBJ7604907.1 CsbD family protein [Candidatus Dormibacteraeota bacterium]